MTSIYEAPSDPEDRLNDIALDSWVNGARWILWFSGMVWLLLGIGSGPLATFRLLTDPSTPTWMSVVILLGSTLIAFLFFGSIGIFNLATASGLGRGSKWAWYATLILGGLYLPTGCCLFGAALLAAMLNDKTRKLFLR